MPKQPPDNAEALIEIGRRTLAEQPFSKLLGAEFKINFLTPARGEMLIARAEAVHVGRGQAVCQCDVVASAPEGERLCATALGTVVRLAGSRPDNQ